MPPAPVQVALLAALSREVQPFLRRLRARRRQRGNFPLWEFTFAGGQGIVALSGMGAAAALRTASSLLGQYQPQALISLGFGGAVTPELAVGDVVLGDSFWFYDPKAGTLEPLPPNRPLAPLAELLMVLHVAGLRAFLGSLVTTPGIISKGPHAGPLTSLPYPVLDLETGAVAQVVSKADLPFLGLRVVSDTAGEEIPDFLAQAVREGREPALRNAWAWVWAEPRRLLVLLRLWRQSRRAAGNLARALEAILKVI